MKFDAAAVVHEWDFVAEQDHLPLQVIFCHVIFHKIGLPETGRTGGEEKGGNIFE